MWYNDNLFERNCAAGNAFLDNIFPENIWRTYIVT